MSKFFISRPIFSIVIAIVMVILGGVGYFQLPVAQYPEITPPTIRVTATYPGATPPVIAETVAAPIEQEVNGVEGMLYMSSSISADGSYQLDITFDLGTDIDIATVLVQNRVSQAEPKLPEEVRRLGIRTKKQSSAILATITLSSPDGRYDDTFLSNYFTLELKDEILRIPGVGDLSIFPSKEYGMRVWLDAAALRARELTATDVVNAIRAQNVQVAAGNIGEEPAPPGNAFTIGVTTLGRLTDADQFADIIVRSEEGRITRVRDVARVELGGKDYNTSASRNGEQTAVGLIFQLPGSNAVEVTEALHELVERAEGRFPEGLEGRIDYDVSAFIEASLEEVFHTLIEAFVLVALVVLLFLGNWRATLIPIITIPISLIATFFVMSLMGFSLNMVTLLGLVLAIGIVVDDAIVVVENVERVMHQHHLPAKEATLKAMGEITGPVIAITLVLMAVFIPAAAMPGITGQIFKQFALTIAVSTAFSAVNALTLSPALCALLLKPHDPNKKPFIVVRVFNEWFGKLTDKFGALAALSIRRLAITGVIFAGLLVLCFQTFAWTPTGFVPGEDQGLLLTEIQMPRGASLQRTNAALAQLSGPFQEIDGVESVVTIAGFGLISGNSPANGLLFLTLEDWGPRAERGRDIKVIQGEVNAILARFQDAAGLSYELPPIPGLGQSGGFDLRILDRGNQGFDTLEGVAQGVIAAANGQARLHRVGTTFRATSPQLRLDIDRDQAQRMDVPLEDAFATLGATLGSTYVNDFNIFGRPFQVRVSGRPEDRSNPQTALTYAVRSRRGTLVQLGAFTTFRDETFPSRLQRDNLYTSAQIVGGPAEGVSSGDALDLMEQICERELPGGMEITWTGTSFQERRASGGLIVFAMAILLVFLILAAQYESWTYPFAVVLSVPMALLGTMGLLIARGYDNNVFVQAGLVLLVGLAAKNAILITEVAREGIAKGEPMIEAILEASKQRFRPIVMTSLAFIVGVVPLYIGTGAGALARRSIGTAVLGGMTGAAILGVLATPPLLYAVLKGTELSKSLMGRILPKKKDADKPPPAAESHAPGE